QAEDGIRDFHVTGVQTCALPIYRGHGLLVEEELPVSADLIGQEGETVLVHREIALGRLRQGLPPPLLREIAGIGPEGHDVAEEGDRKSVVEGKRVNVERRGSSR